MHEPGPKNALAQLSPFLIPSQQTGSMGASIFPIARKKSADLVG
jgi:hypothetical protein